MADLRTVNTGKTVTGARAIVSVKGNIVGIFDSCTANRSFGEEAIHILGRYSAAELVYTSSEPCSLSCSGFRVVDQGVHVLPAVPKVQDLLGFESMEISVTDRLSGKVIMTVHKCLATNDNVNYNAKATSRVTIGYTGIIADDESGSQTEAVGATDLP